MKEHPILFSTAMVQAILAGRKTMTRRVIKFPKDYDVDALVYNNYPHGLKYNSTLMGGTVQRLEPKWAMGDVLWVRETFGKSGERVFHKADNDDFENAGLMGLYDFKWKPSIFMPKEACRIRLKITNVRVERLHDITEQDGKKEGVEKIKDGFKIYDRETDQLAYNSRASFMTLWSKINGMDGWDANPWVWVIEFEKQ